MSISSQDDLDVILHGTLHQRKKLNEKRSGGKSSSEDEFEKEMKAELNVTMKTIEANHTAATRTCELLITLHTTAFMQLFQ